MMAQPRSIDELRAAIVERPRVSLRGAGTKPALARDGDAVDLSALIGAIEHTPEECTFTALAGTRLADIERLLAAHSQYLPFDPPLVQAGATIGGTVAAGLNGSCRYRYGGIRDFLIGARIVDGRGTLIRSGGKVVKNAAGFLLHQAMVGSCGRFGVLAEMTFKVFPSAQAYATIRLEARDLEDAVDVLESIDRGHFELDAVDIEAPSTVWLRIGGFAGALFSRAVAVQRAANRAADILLDASDEAVWRGTREFTWVSPGTTLVRVPLTAAKLLTVDALLARGGAARRYSVAGNVVWVAWPGPIASLSEGLAGLDLVGQVVLGAPGQPFIGAVRSNEFERRVRAVMDPDDRFS